MGLHVSVVVMAFDEAATLEDASRELQASLARIGRAYEVLIVDDGSRDGTGALADRLARELPGFRALHHPVNRGVGGVYDTGFSEARGDLLTFFPADGQFPAATVERFVAVMDGADIVLGHASGPQRPLLGRVLSRAERVFYRLLFGPIPPFQGMMMFRRELLDRLGIVSSGRGGGALFELIIRAARTGCRIESVPTELRPRRSGSSKVQNASTIGSTLWQALALRMHL